METGDILQIKGTLGFLLNPTIKVLEATEDSVKVISVDRIGDDKGLLSHMNESWYSKEFIKSKIA